MNLNPLPTIIQGGMGAGVSSWQLARAVACAGHLGVVSGAALDVRLPSTPSIPPGAWLAGRRG